MDDLTHAWERIETRLRHHRCTSALPELRPPAPEEAVQTLQDAIPYPLHPHPAQRLGPPRPDSFRAPARVARAHF